MLIYELVDDYLERRAALRAEHLGLARAAHERGELLLAGALADPYVANGLVSSWTVRQWNEVLEAG